MLAFQGPKAPEMLTRLAEADLVKPPRFTAVQTRLLGDVPVLLGRTGYTGEDGYELFVPAEKAVKVWEGILKVAEPEGVKPIGLAARDSLRFEACMPLYGHEINAEITPVEARLGFALSLEKHFIGRDALLEAEAGRTEASAGRLRDGRARPGPRALSGLEGWERGRSRDLRHVRPHPGPLPGHGAAAG